MSYFLSDLNVDFYQVGKRRRLLSDLCYASTRLNRVVTVPAGFETDFASVPRLPFAFLLAGDCGHYAATVHDWLYSSKEVSRFTADATLLEALEVTGVQWWRRYPMWAAVRLFGWAAWCDK